MKADNQLYQLYQVDNSHAGHLGYWSLREQHRMMP